MRHAEPDRKLAKIAGEHNFYLFRLAGVVSMIRFFGYHGLISRNTGIKLLELLEEAQEEVKKARELAIKKAKRKRDLTK